MKMPSEFTSSSKNIYQVPTVVGGENTNELDQILAPTDLNILRETVKKQMSQSPTTKTISGCRKFCEGN
jgi:hypothetical protein